MTLYNQIKTLAQLPNLKPAAREELGYARGSLAMGHRYSARKSFELALAIQKAVK